MRFFSSRMNLARPSITHSYLVPPMYQRASIRASGWSGDKRIIAYDGEERSAYRTLFSLRPLELILTVL